jgi:hypothetical protein
MLNDEYQSMAANGIVNAATAAGQAWQDTAYEHMRPCVLFKPALTRDGDRWCALYGENIQVGVVGFGKTPCDAMVNFDRAYYGIEATA